MIKQLLSKHKRDIIVGTSASLIASFLWTLADWFIKNAPTLGNTALDTAINIIYVLSANQTHSTLIEFALFTVFWCGAVFFIRMLIQVGRHVISVSKLWKYIKNNLIADSMASTEAVELPIEKRAEKLYQSSLLLAKLSVLSGILGFLMAFLIYFVIIKPHTLWINFEQDITMISPYIEETEVRQLQSNWVCMRSKDDYMEIYKVIDNIKHIHSLPK